MDVGTGIAVLGPSAVVLKILGPTADYVGEGLQEWTQRRVANVQRIFANAERKLSAEQLDAPGAVPPRVLKGILDEGSFREDELSAEYLGGVLAASRTETGRDDRGASLVAVVGRLSTYQLRSHYIFYTLARRALVGMDLNLSTLADRRANQLFVPLHDYITSMEFSGEEVHELPSIVSHSLYGLGREDLLKPRAWGASKHLRESPRWNKDFGPAGGFVFEVTMLGVELFCAAHGLRAHEFAAAFLDPNSDFTDATAIPIEAEVVRFEDLPAFEPSQDPETPTALS